MLDSYERITVRQQVEPLQVFTGLEMSNRYAVIDDDGKDILFAYEESSFLGRQFLGRQFDLYDDRQLVGKVEGPLLRPNTFWVGGSREGLAKITKQWSGVSREMFTAADTFHIEYTDSSLSESMRWLILGAAFAIDLDFFENRGRGGRFNVGGFGR